MDLRRIMWCFYEGYYRLRAGMPPGEMDDPQEKDRVSEVVASFRDKGTSTYVKH